MRKQTTLPAARTIAGVPQRGSIHGFAVEAFSYTGDPVNGNYLGQNEQSIQNEIGPCASCGCR